jgi:DNA-binding response OmpR family regulator
MPHPKKILVVDDDQPTRDFVAEVLEEEGYLVRSAESTTHALAAIEAESYDAVLLDLRMPGINGVELFRILYERSLATMPIIFMTADNKSLQELLAQGVKFILFKPFNLDTLLKCVAEALRARQETQDQGTPLPATQDLAELSKDVHICAET